MDWLVDRYINTQSPTQEGQTDRYLIWSAMLFSLRTRIWFTHSENIVFVKPVIADSKKNTFFVSAYLNSGLIHIKCIGGMKCDVWKQDKWGLGTADKWAVRTTRSLYQNQLDALLSQIYFGHETLHVSESSSVHHQEFIYCTLSNGICHTGLLTAFEQDQDGTAFRPGPARKLSTNLYGIYHC
jgi:hypothetical protein